MEVSVRAAKPADLPSIRSLLTSVDLTVAGVAQDLDHFLVVENAGKIVACAGLETYGFHALLRSVAVHPQYRNRGLATSLVTRLVDRARQDRLHTVSLLTTTAEAYFRRLGFATISRADVDPGVTQSAEFAEGVCATSCDGPPPASCRQALGFRAEWNLRERGFAIPDVRGAKLY